MQKLALVIVILFQLISTTSSSQCYVGANERLQLLDCSTRNQIRHKRQATESAISMEVNATAHLRAENLTDNGPMPTLASTSQPSGQALNSSHLPDISISENTTLSKLPTSLQPPSANLTQPAHSCLTFFPSAKISESNASAQPELLSDCDYGRICDGGSGPQHHKMINTTYNGSDGVMFCCQGDGCNTGEVAAPSPTSRQPLKCFIGENETLAQCQDASWVCMNSTRTSNAFAKFASSMYGCELLSDSMCNTTTSHDKCIQHSTVSGQTETRCCCFSDNCNAPPIPKVNESQAASSIMDAFDGVRWIVYGWAIVVGITMLAGTTALIVKWRRRRDDDSVCIISNPRFQRLAANFVAGDTDDVKMLLADPEC